MGAHDRHSVVPPVDPPPGSGQPSAGQRRWRRPLSWLRMPSRLSLPSWLSLPSRLRILSAVVITLAALAVAAASQAQPGPTAALFDRAVRALAAANYPLAESLFQQVLRREPDNLGAWGNLGVVYSRQNLPVKAVETYQRALRLAPAEPGLLLNLGLAYLKLDQHAAAKPLFARLAATSAQARELHAICQLQTGEIAAARETLEAILDSPASYHFLALAYAKEQKLEQARRILDQLFTRLPPAQAHYLEGRVWYDATLFDRALASYERAATHDPKLPGLALELGKTHLSLRQDEAAERYLRQALAASPADTEARYFLGALLVQRGQFEPALPLLESVQVARPDLWGTSYYLGKAQLALGKPALALPQLRQAARRAPAEAPVQFQLARALQALGRTAEAAQAFARVRQLQAAANNESIVMK